MAPTDVMTAAVPQMVRFGDLLMEWDAEMEALNASYVSGQARGPVTGLPSLDRDLGGFLAPGIHVLDAGPGVGKSCLALQIAATCGRPALYVSCEMGRLDLFRRHVARVTGTFLGKLKSGELAPETTARLARQAAAVAPDLVLVDATRAAAPVGWLERAAAIVRHDRPDLLIVVDSAHSWSGALDGDSSEYDRLNAALSGLQQLAARLESPVLIIAERSRVGMKEGGISASAGSRRFEYSAETVLSLDRAKEAMPDPMGEIPVTLRLEKNRHGMAGKKLMLKFHGALQRFREG